MRSEGSCSAGRLRPLLLFGTAVPLLLIAQQPAAASGFYLQEQSVRGWGRANSGEVADQGPASLWWNPAAIGWEEDRSAAFGATAILPLGRVRDDGTVIDRPGGDPTPVGGAPVQRDPVQKGIAPGSAAAMRLTDRLAVGFVLASPFSFTTDYDESGWQRYSAIRTRLITLDLQPTIAWAPSDSVSVGAALNIQYSDAYLSNALPNLAAGSADGKLILKGDGVDLGWSAGVQVRAAPRMTLGLSYKSAISHELGGDVEIRGLAGPLAARNMTSDVVASFDTPWQLIIGARAGVTEATTLNVQAVRFGWSKFDRLEFSAPLSSFIAQDYKDTWSLAFGLDHVASSRLTLRAGVQFDATPTRDDRRDPRVADGDRINYNAGMSLRMSEHLTLDAAASFTDFRDSRIGRDEIFYAGTPAETRVFTDGRMTDQRAFVLSMGGRLAF